MRPELAASWTSAPVAGGASEASTFPEAVGLQVRQIGWEPELTPPLPRWREAPQRLKQYHAGLLRLKLLEQFVNVAVRVLAAIHQHQHAVLG